MNLCVRVDYEVSSLEFPFYIKLNEKTKITRRDLKFIVNDIYGKYETTINHKLPRKLPKLLIMEAY